MVIWVSWLLRNSEGSRIVEISGLSSMNQMKRFVLDETALETVEWAIVGGIITAVGVALYATIGGDISRGLGSLSGVTNGIP
jgi:Flp pilus assembly pilin Flp